MDVAHIRELLREGRFSFFFHAFQEALKDGITGDDISYVIEHGEIIEEYSDRQRCLIFGTTSQRMPLHIVVDYSRIEELYIVTVYVPDSRQWIAYRKRRKDAQ